MATFIDRLVARRIRTSTDPAPARTSNTQRPPSAPLRSSEADSVARRSHEPSRRPRIGVWGHYYGANLGDELVTSLIIEALQARQPDAEILGFSLAPDDTQERYGIPSFPIIVRHNIASPRTGTSRLTGWRRVARGLFRRAVTVALEPPHLWNSYRALRGTDYIVVAGSGQLMDAWWGGSWGHPYTVVKWALLARLRGARLIFLSVGAGPLDRRLGRFFVRAALRLADYISVRDQHSVRVLRAAGVRRPLPVAPDSAFALERDFVAPPASDDRLVVGLNPIAHARAAYWGTGDEDRYRDYVRGLAGFVSTLVRRGHEVRFFSSQETADLSTVHDVIAELRNDDASIRDRVRVEKAPDVDQLLRVVEGCDYVVAARFHGALLPLRMGIPALALSYHPKTEELMERLGQSAYCVDIDDATEELLLDRFTDLCNHGAEIRAELAERIPSLHAEAVAQFDYVLGSLRSE